MQIRTSKLLVVGAADGCAVAIMLPEEKGKETPPKMVAATFQANGEKAEILCSTDEARVIGEALLTAGCVAAGGMPPVLQAEPATKPTVLA